MPRTMLRCSSDSALTKTSRMPFTFRISLREPTVSGVDDGCDYFPQLSSATDPETELSRM